MAIPKKLLDEDTDPDDPEAVADWVKRVATRPGAPTLDVSPEVKAWQAKHSRPTKRHPLFQRKNLGEGREISSPASPASPPALSVVGDVSAAPAMSRLPGGALVVLGAVGVFGASFLFGRWLKRRFFSDSRDRVRGTMTVLGA